MSKRRKVGDCVEVIGVTGVIANLNPDTDPEGNLEKGPCIQDCGDPDCCSWNNVITGDGWVHHIDECLMGDG